MVEFPITTIFEHLILAARWTVALSLKPFLTYACVALCYFVLCYPVSLYAKRLERRMALAR